MGCPPSEVALLELRLKIRVAMDDRTQCYSTFASAFNELVDGKKLLTSCRWTRASLANALLVCGGRLDVSIMIYDSLEL